MARTRKTQPYFSRVLEPGAAAEAHDHCAGPCDLPDFDVWAAAHRARPDGLQTPSSRCQWVMSDHYLHTHTLCGCYFCAAHPFRRAERRASRHTARKEGRAQARDSNRAAWAVTQWPVQ